MSLSDYFTNPLVMLAYSFWNRKSGTRHLDILRDMDKSQFYNGERLREMQTAKLRRALRNAFRNSSFWQKRFNDIGIKEEDIKSMTSTQGLPELTREDVINHKDEIVSSAFMKSGLIDNVSGGTTGSSLSYYLSKHRIDVRTASTLRHNLWTSYRIGDKLATVWGAPDDIASHKPLKTKVREMLWGKSIDFNSNILTDGSVRSFALEWDKFRPAILLAYSGALNFFVNHAKDLKLSFAPPRAIITSAEVLTPEARKNIEDFFGAKVFNRYGSREFSVIASECDRHSGFHINAENLFLEYELIDESSDERRHAKILVTDLENMAFPFIRYEIGDVAVVSENEEQCECGRALPRIHDIGGRMTDYLRLPDGRYISCTGLTVTVFPKAKGIVQSRIIQKKADKIIVQIVKNSEFDQESDNILRKELGKVLGDGIEVELEFPEEIKREKSGKYRFAISEVSD
jgi:phenylacetate-CoA ligase